MPDHDTPDLDALTKRVLPLLAACSVQISGCWRSTIREAQEIAATVEEAKP